MNVKITFFIEGVQFAFKYASSSVGWTETWYASSATITSLDAWLTATDVLSYIALRRAVLPTTYRISWVRISDEANPRSFKILAVSAGVGSAATISYAAGNGVGIAEGQVQCALLVDMVRLPTAPGETTHHRRFLLRALPADVINGNVVSNIGPNWPSVVRFLNFLAFYETGSRPPLPGTAPAPGILANTTLGLRYQSPTLAAWTPLPNVTPLAADPRSISVAAVIGAVSSKVQIRRAPDTLRALNRTWSVISNIAGPPADTILGRAKRDLQDISYTAPGTAQYRVVAPVYGLFNQYTIIGLRNKKTGRIFRQLRGRSSAR